MFLIKEQRGRRGFRKAGYTKEWEANEGNHFVSERE